MFLFFFLFIIRASLCNYWISTTTPPESRDFSAAASTRMISSVSSRGMAAFPVRTDSTNPATNPRAIAPISLASIVNQPFSP